MTTVTEVVEEAATPDPPPPPAAADAAPEFVRTVDRRLVHRAAVSEVFVTDLRRDGDGFLAGAQLPLSHGYFGDHLRRPAAFDFLLLLESARQACTAAGHLYYGVPRDTVFLVNGFSVRITDQGALTAGTRPGELVLAGGAVRDEGRGGRLRGVRFDVTLSLAGRQAARIGIDTSTAAGEDYRKLRFLQRRSTPPVTEDLDTTTAGRPADAAAVGRRNPLNVVLGEPVREGAAVSAPVEPRWENRSLFDHSYDHIPAMVLVEAARQLAHLAGVPVTAPVAACTARFTRFVELDSSVTATARADRPGAGAPTPPCGLLVEFRQNGATVAETELDFGPAAGEEGA
ncbi:ScbA/BarX family gamma-butyrolactone biosynthesis protein [Streptomyces sp. NPDC006193]|uniref:ScbA/BarX family gamma-butyrolactone biosynthesis protein n=1 Tax=Streptomyces sp. NPDC006193 TaxID=3155717 RepID=UPI0033B5CE62